MNRWRLEDDEDDDDLDEDDEDDDEDDDDEEDDEDEPETWQVARHRLPGKSTERLTSA